MDAFSKATGCIAAYNPKVLHRVFGIDDPGSIKMEESTARSLHGFRFLELCSDVRPRHSK